MNQNPDSIPRALGVRWTGSGVEFRLYSENATAIELCLFSDQADAVPSTCIPLQRTERAVWQTFVDNAKSGDLYSYRIDGPSQPSIGHRFHPDRFLIDPYARAITADPGVLGPSRTETTTPGDLEALNLDAPKCVVVDPSFDWAADKRPRTAWTDTVIYECHLRGMTIGHPDVPANLRGTYLGLAHAAVIDHLIRLGVTAIELLPIQQIASEPHLTRRGLTNYFGYSPLGLFAPHGGYATTSDGSQVAEFKQLVKKCHSAGLEVILDIVLNHTAEGDEDGPLLSLRGIDNSVYYRLNPDNKRQYIDYTGCGNTLNLDHPKVVDLVVDCLRYWSEEMRVDGFRLDLATCAGRTGDGFSPLAPVFERIHHDPMLSKLKWIAEPWDLGPAGYRLGEFPANWAEWNDRYRDTLRSFWRGNSDGSGYSGSSGGIVDAFAGSPSIFQRPSRGPNSSINLITCHDGFTLTDLVSYEAKHNLPNGEDNRDGWDDNLSRNWGVEGPTDDPEIRDIRDRVRRSLIGSLALSAGVPMLLHGDELGRTQLGNNNAYCQDNATTWIDWDLRPDQQRFLAFTRSAFQLRKSIREFLAKTEGSSPTYSEAELPSSPLHDGDHERLAEGGHSILGIYVELETKRLLYILNPDPKDLLVALPSSSNRSNQSQRTHWKVLFGSEDSQPSPLQGTDLQIGRHSLVVLKET